MGLNHAPAEDEVVNALSARGGRVGGGGGAALGPPADLEGHGGAQLEAGAEGGELLAFDEHRPEGRGDAEGEEGEGLVFTQSLGLDDHATLGPDTPRMVVGVARLSEESRLTHQAKAQSRLAHAPHDAKRAAVPVGSTEAAGNPVDPSVEDDTGRGRLHHDADREAATAANPAHAEVGDGVVPDHQRRSADDQAGLGLGLQTRHPLLQAGEPELDVRQGVLDRLDADHRGVEVGLADFAREGGLRGLESGLQVRDVDLDLLGGRNADPVDPRLQRGQARLQGACATLERQDVLPVEGRPGVHGGGRAGACPDDGRGLGPRRVGGGQEGQGHEDQGHQEDHAITHGVSLALSGRWG